MSSHPVAPMSVIQPVILFLDNLLKVHKLIDLDSLEYFIAGKQFEEFPSTIYREDLFDRLYKEKVRFVVESTHNLDPSKMVLDQDFGNMKWYRPKYCAEQSTTKYDVKVALIKNIKKVKYMTLSLSEIRDLPAQGLRLILIHGPLSKKLCNEFNLKRVKGANFTYFQVRL